MGVVVIGLAPGSAFEVRQIRARASITYLEHDEGTDLVVGCRGKLPPVIGGYPAPFLEEKVRDAMAWGCMNSKKKSKQARQSTPSSTISASSSIELLINNLRRAYSGKAWHGPTLKGTLRGVTLKQASRRVTHNSVRDLVYHCAYWKYCVRRWMLDAAGNDPGPAFPRSPANFPNPKARVTEKDFAADKRMLDAEHKRLLAAIKALPPGVLGKPAGNTGLTNAEVILGVAAHDLYHAGQISLIKRM